MAKEDCKVDKFFQASGTNCPLHHCVNVCPYYQTLARYSGLKEKLKDLSYSSAKIIEELNRLEKINDEDSLL